MAYDGAPDRTAQHDPAPPSGGAATRSLAPGGQPGPAHQALRKVAAEPAADEIEAVVEPVRSKAPSADEPDQRIELPEPKAPRTIVFDDSTSDDLDVPDFLK